MLRSIALLAAAAVCTLSTTVSAAVKPPVYYCETDEDCEGTFPGTVCIEVDNYGEVTKKCTPNTASRPACRGAQPGLCPSYQSEEVGYLNVHCVFVAVDAEGEDVVDSTGGTKDDSETEASVASSGSGSADTKRRGRWLMLAASEDGSSSPEVIVSSSGSSGETTAPVVSTGAYAKVKIGKETVTGQFRCVDVSDCARQAYDPTTCETEACGSPNSLMQCNNHGTCTYKSVQKMSTRSCMCFAGFSGDKCQQEISNECDVDCGLGGDCVDGECKCKKGFDGKKYKGKQGKPNQRCTKCTNDLACQNDNACDIDTGVCVCSPGYGGPTCGATEDSCTRRNCGDLGTCKLFANGSSACYCLTCDPDCELCKANDCSTCPSASSTIGISKAVIAFASVAALLLGNLVF